MTGQTNTKTNAKANTKAIEKAFPNVQVKTLDRQSNPGLTPLPPQI